MAAPRIGVLALQGAFSKHIEMLRGLGAEAIEVRKAADLPACDALIIPGGESTTMQKQMHFIELAEPLKAFGKHKPLFGTCAGLILMSHEVIGGSIHPLQLLDIKVERNAFGRQKESFQTIIHLQLGGGAPHPFPSIFIRAPRIREAGPEVVILAKYQEEPVLVRQGIHLGSTFHPELGSDPAVHAYFLNMVKQKGQ